MARTSQEDLDRMGFGRAFNTSRNELGGAGKTFTWRGKSYTTNLAEEERGSSSAPASSPRPQRNPRRGRSVDEIASSASAAIDRAEGRPQTTPQRNPRRVPGPNEGTATSVNTPEITRSALPAAVQAAVDSATTAAQRSRAESIAEEGTRRRVPGGAIVQAIRNYLRGEGPTNPTAILREGRPPGMARGGMVKKGNTDRRNKGMFYDSKSPRGYK